MGLTEEEKTAIVKYRLEKARDTLLDVDIAIQNHRWNNATNRLYYACYYAASALLINYGHVAHTHSGVKSLLGLHYVTTGLINDTLNKAYNKMFNLRQTGDYDDLYNVTEDDVNPLLEPAKQFIQTIEQLILTKLN
ncbi:hypothetical protein FACS1894201_00110 [Bacteroidia bacterium]|nr:hypothetical protein FACS1894201_00110 [Bacteroidia bacterium]